MLELRADEGAAGVGGVHVEPGVLLLAQGPDLGEGVEGAARRRAQRGAHLRMVTLASYSLPRAKGGRRGAAPKEQRSTMHFASCSSLDIIDHTLRF